MSTRAQPSEPVTSAIAESVRRLRLARDMSQEALAKAMTAQGVPWRRSSVAELERRAPSVSGKAGRDAVTAGELLALARVFGVEPAELLGEVG